MTEQDNKTKNKEISVIVAIRNEEAFIDKCLDSLINQDFLKNNYEIIVIDGLSDDKTREKISLYKKKYPNLIKIFDNPKKLQAPARNIGIKNAEGNKIVIFDGHACAHPQFLTKLLNELENCLPNVGGVGAVHSYPKDEIEFGKITGDVQNSFLGGAGTSFRLQGRKYADHVAFAIYRKDFLEKIGLYDERFVIAEDVEINWRLKKAGFKLKICHEAKVYYYRKHNSLKLLSQRMLKYGKWKTLLTKKHPDAFKFFWLFPIILIFSIISLPVFIYFNIILEKIIIGALILYFILIISSSFHLIIKRKNFRYIIAIPIYLILHFSMGFGLLIGLFTKLPKNY